MYIRSSFFYVAISPFGAITKHPVFHHKASGFPSGIRFSPSIRFHELRGFRPLPNRQLDYSLNIFALRRSPFHAQWMLCFASLMVVFSDIIASCFTTCVIVPGPGSRSYRVPTLPNPTGYYYCTLQLGCRIVVAIYSVHVEVN